MDEGTAGKSLRVYGQNYNLTKIFEFDDKYKSEHGEATTYLKGFPLQPGTKETEMRIRENNSANFAGLDKESVNSPPMHLHPTSTGYDNEPSSDDLVLHNKHTDFAVVVGNSNENAKQRAAFFYNFDGKKYNDGNKVLGINKDYFTKEKNKPIEQRIQTTPTK